MVRIAYFHNECAPYRTEVFKEISNLPNVDLKVYFGRFRSSNRKWNVKLNHGFDYKILREIRSLGGLFGFDANEDPNPVNLGLPFTLLRGKYDLFIGGAPHYFGTIMTYLVSRICRKPFILFLEDVDFIGDEMVSYVARFRKNSLLSFKIPLILLRYFFSQIIVKKSNSYVVPGTASKEYLLRRGVPSYKIFTAVNAVNNKKIQADCRKSLMKGNGKKIRQLLNAENKKMVLSVAYLSEKKGLQYLIKACGQLNKTRNDISLVIVGEGEYKNDLQSLADQNGINASFAGYVPDLATFPDLATYYLAADVFVLPTLRDVWGLVINEAMACGCPVITTRNAAGSRDLVKNGVNGYVVEEKNVKQLKNALEKILYDEVVKQRMKQASKDIIRNFSYENNAMGYKAAIAFSLESRFCRSRN